MKLWDVTTRKELATLKGPGYEVPSPLAFAPDGKTLATGSEDRTAKLWDITTGKELATLKGHTDYVSSVAFAPDGKTLATGSYDQTVKLWDVRTGKELATLKRQYNLGFLGVAKDLEKAAKLYRDGRTRGTRPHRTRGRGEEMVQQGGDVVPQARRPW